MINHNPLVKPLLHHEFYPLLYVNLTETPRSDCHSDDMAPPWMTMARLLPAQRSDTKAASRSKSRVGRRSMSARNRSPAAVALLRNAWERVGSLAEMGGKCLRNGWQKQPFPKHFKCYHAVDQLINHLMVINNGQQL